MATIQQKNKLVKKLRDLGESYSEIDLIREHLEILSNTIDELKRTPAEVSRKDITSLQIKIAILSQTLVDLSDQITVIKTSSPKEPKDDIAAKPVTDLKSDLENKISLLRNLVGQSQGRSKPPKISNNGTDINTRYVDINYISGTGVVLTTANNDNTKNVDISISVTDVINFIGKVRASLSSSGVINFNPITGVFSLNQVTNETPTGSVTGTNGTDGNATFTLANTPISSSLEVWVSGQKQKLTTDYTLTGNTITFVSGSIPVSPGWVLVNYRF